MGLPLVVEYRLGPEEFRAGVEVMFAPTPAVRAARRLLLVLAWTLWIPAGALIVYVWVLLWGRACLLRPVASEIPISGRSAMAWLTAVWAGLGWAAWKLPRLPEPNWAQRWVHGVFARRALSRGGAGLRRLTLTAEGFELEAPGGKHSRSWPSVRIAKRDDAFLALAARGVWVFVPLRVLKDEARDALLSEVSARTCLLKLESR